MGYTFFMNHTELNAAVVLAMKERDELKLSVLRGLKAAATNELVSKNRKPTEELSEEDLQAVIMRATKQRKDSIEQFRKGGREELAAKEEAELAILQSFLPAQMSQDEIEPLAKAKIAEMSADKSKAGQVMGALMRDLKGKADGADVKAVVERLLA